VQFVGEGFQFGRFLRGGFHGVFSGFRGFVRGGFGSKNRRPVIPEIRFLPHF
jgi:hypothetical protein